MASANPQPIAGVEPDLEYVFSAMHTALRKLCDSKLTSAAWNAFHVIGDDTRAWLVKAVTDAIKAKPLTTDVALISAIKTELNGEDAFGKHERMMIACMLEAFTHNDWLGMLGFTIIYPKETE